MCTSWDQPPCVASSLDDEVDLNAGPKRQRGHRDRRASGKGLTEILGVDAIHRAEITQAREIHAGARNVIETPAGRLENRREIPQDALCLGRNTPLDHLASGRVLADLTAEVEETTDFDRLRKRPDRRRKFGRGNCGLAHGTLRWILGLDGRAGATASNSSFAAALHAFLKNRSIRIRTCQTTPCQLIGRAPSTTPGEPSATVGIF